MNEPRTVKGAILSHTLVNCAGTVLTLAAYPVLFTWLVRDLGLVLYGAYSLLTALALQFNLFDDSLGAWISREVSRGPGARADAALRRRLGCAATLYLLLGVPVVVVVALATVFGLRHHEPGLVWVVLAAGVPAHALNLGASLATHILVGRERFAIIKAAHVGSLLVRLGGIALVRFAWPETDRLVAYAAVFVLSVAFQAVVSGLAVRATVGFFPRPAVQGLGTVRRAATRFGLPLFGVKLTTLLANRLDLWLVAALLSPEAIGTYGIAVGIYRIVIQALEATRAFILPVSVRLKRTFSPSRYRDFFLRATSLSVLVTFGAGTVLLLNLGPLLEAWLGGPALTAIPPAALLLAFAMTTSLRSVGQTVLAAEGRFHLLVAPFVAAALVNFALSVWGTVLLGVAGPAVGTFVGGLFLVGWNLDRICRALDVKRAAYLGAVGPGLMVWTLAAAAGYGAGAYAGGVPGIAVRTLVYVGLHVLLYFAFVLGEADRTFLLGLIRRPPGKAAA